MTRGCRSMRLSAIASIAVALAAGTVAPGDDRISAGLGGVRRTGFWTPLVVRPAADDAAVRAWVEDADGQLVGYPVAAAAAGVARTSVRPGRPAARMAIEPVREGQGSDTARPARPGPASEREFPGTVVSSTTPLVLVHGDLPAAEAAVRLAAGERPLPEVVLLDATPVPPDLAPRELDAFDAAIVCGRAIGSLEPATLVALDGWIRRGGSLVFIAGASAEAVAAGGGVAASWLPGTAPTPVPLRRFDGLEAYARVSGLTGRVPADGVRVPRFAGQAGGGGGVTGLTEVSGGTGNDLPLVVRRAHGFGTITWLGLDVDEPWFRSWPDGDRLLATLLGGRGEYDGGLVAPEATAPRVPDLAGQFRVALDGFPGAVGGPPATGVPFEVIAGLGLLYVLALFPLEWWLVSRSRRPWLSWVTLPTITACFAAAAWAVGGAWGRDTPPRCHAAEVLDVDVAGRFCRGFSWLAARSPANTLLDVAAAAEPNVATGADVAVSWLADAGRGFGGMDALVAHPALAAADYAYGESLATLRAVPVAAASSRLFEAEWTAASTGPPATASLVRDAQGLLGGSLAHHLPFPLADCRLLHGGWLYDVGDLAPGETFDPAAGRGPRSLLAELTGRTAVGERERTPRWDASATDLGRILRVAGFHHAAGGFAYTSLEPGRLGRLDLSRLLAVDRAVLVGVAPPAGRSTAWTVGLCDETGRVAPLAPEPADGGSLVRIVIPILPAEEPR